MGLFAVCDQSLSEELYLADRARSKVCLTCPSQHGVIARPVSRSLRSITLKIRPLLTDSTDYHGGGRTGGIRAGNQTAKQKKRFVLYSLLKRIYNDYFTLFKRTSRARLKKRDRGLKASMLKVS